VALRAGIRSGDGRRTASVNSLGAGRIKSLCCLGRGDPSPGAQAEGRVTRWLNELIRDYTELLVAANPSSFFQRSGHTLDAVSLCLNGNPVYSSAPAFPNGRA